MIQKLRTGFQILIPLMFSGIFLGLGSNKMDRTLRAAGLAILFFLSRGYEYNDINNQLP